MQKIFYGIYYERVLKSYYNDTFLLMIILMLIIYKVNNYVSVDSTRRVLTRTKMYPF